jgi:hypothetical protein
MFVYGTEDDDNFVNTFKIFKRQGIQVKHLKKAAIMYWGLFTKEEI